MTVRAALTALGLIGACAVPACGAGRDGVRMATFSVATASYGHGALGPGHEWARLNIQGDAGSLSFQDERALVFEDIAPRLIDLDGDGDNEAMVVESSQTQGSRLAIRQSGRELVSWPLDVVPDALPLVALSQPPKETLRTGLRLDVEASDD